jgi:hypothetical protein
VEQADGEASPREASFTVLTINFRNVLPAKDGKAVYERLY